MLNCEMYLFGNGFFFTLYKMKSFLLLKYLTLPLNIFERSLISVQKIFCSYLIWRMCLHLLNYTQNACLIISSLLKSSRLFHVHLMKYLIMKHEKINIMGTNYTYQRWIFVNAKEKKTYYLVSAAHQLGKDKV